MNGLVYDTCPESKRPGFDLRWRQIFISPDLSENTNVSVCTEKGEILVTRKLVSSQTHTHARTRAHTCIYIYKRKFFSPSTETLLARIFQFSNTDTAVLQRQLGATQT